MYNKYSKIRDEESVGLESESIKEILKEERFPNNLYL